jgi:hypothetical protein
MTPRQIRAVTQALIDALLDEGTRRALDRPDGIRRAAFEYGIGIDCAGYVQQAFLASRRAARAAFGFTAFDNENLSGLKARGPFDVVNIRKARTGDLICLDSATEVVGHTTIVYSHVVAETEDALVNKYGGDAGSLLPDRLGSGPAHLYYVDASWGAGPYGAPWGGVLRKPWTFNEATGTWAFFRGGLPAVSITSGPYDHTVQAVYRPLQEVKGDASKP